MKLSLPISGQEKKLRTRDAIRGAMVKTKNPTPFGRRKNNALRASPCLRLGARLAVTRLAVVVPVGTTVADMFSLSLFRTPCSFLVPRGRACPTGGGLRKGTEGEPAAPHQKRWGAAGLLLG
jgi:hypothetical protein